MEVEELKKRMRSNVDCYVRNGCKDAAITYLQNLISEGRKFWLYCAKDKEEVERAAAKIAVARFAYCLARNYDLDNYVYYNL